MAKMLTGFEILNHNGVFRTKFPRLIIGAGSKLRETAAQRNRFGSFLVHMIAKA